MLWSLLIIVTLGVLLFALWLWQRKRKRLSKVASERILQRLARVGSLSDPHRRVLEADAVLDLVLTALGYQGSLGEKLRKAEPLIPNINAVWSAHRLRNKIAHEPGISIPNDEIMRAVRTLTDTVHAFCK